jgi:hypothetical protein
MTIVRPMPFISAFYLGIQQGTIKDNHKKEKNGKWINDKVFCLAKNNI